MKKILLSSIVATLVAFASDFVHVDIDNSDQLVVDTCCLDFVNLWNPEPVAQPGCFKSWGGPDKTLPWTYPMIFESEDNNITAKKWSPDYAGIKIFDDNSEGATKDSKIIELRFVMSDEDIDFFKNLKFKANFNNDAFRVPLALEIDFVFKDYKLNKVVDVVDEENRYHTNNLSGLLKKDLSTRREELMQFEYIIYEPNKLEPGKVYYIKLISKNGFRNIYGDLDKFNVHFNFQISLNMKYIQAIISGESTECDHMKKDGIIITATDKKDKKSG